MNSSLNLFDVDTDEQREICVLRNYLRHTDYLLFVVKREN